MLHAFAAAHTDRQTDASSSGDGQGLHHLSNCIRDLGQTEKRRKTICAEQRSSDLRDSPRRFGDEMFGEKLAIDVEKSWEMARKPGI